MWMPVSVIARTAITTLYEDSPGHGSLSLNVW
jgi:hypothetical protein